MTAELEMTIVRYKAGSVQYPMSERRFYFREYKRLKKKLKGEETADERHENRIIG